MKKVFLSLIFLGALVATYSCGGTTTPNVTGTKDDPSIQAVKALFASSSDNATITSSMNAEMPIIFDLVLGQDTIPCDSGTRSMPYDGGTVFPTFNNCEFILSNLTAYNTPSCIKKITLNGALTFTMESVGVYDGTPGSSSARTNTMTQSLSMNFEMADGSTHSVTSCEFNIISTTTWNEFDNPWVNTGTICGVDIATVNNACSL